MNILMGYTYRSGSFIPEGRQTEQDFETLRAEYISDEGGDDTIGWRCHSIKLKPDLTVIGAPDLASLMFCPVYFVIDPNSTGMNSQGKMKIPTVMTVIKAGEPQPLVPPGSSLGAVEDQHNKPEKGGTK